MPLHGRGNLDKAIDNLVYEKDKQLKGIFFTGLQNIQLGTPVDTGAARNNWFFSENSPSNEMTSKASGNNINIDEFPDVVANTGLYFTNNLPYIIPLEYAGHSGQAPSGWVRTEIHFMRKAIRNIK